LGQVIPFSKIESYLNSIQDADKYKGAIFDTNVLISASYEVRDSYQDVVDLWTTLLKYNYQVFATINTRSEYLEFHRRLILTENLFDLVSPSSGAKIPNRAKARIQTLKGSLKTSVASDSEKDEVFNDTQIKKIKKEFSAGLHSGQKGWLQICEFFLKDQILLADQDLKERDVKYITPNKFDQSDLFNSSIEWSSAIKICEHSGTSFSDSMILNALKSSKFHFIVTLDFDIGYSALSDPNIKDVVVPDGLFKEFKKFHFPRI
jgi:predicted nucleic acid-binding protein